MARAILFDMDGTLIDTNDAHARAWQDAFRKWDKEVSFEAVRGFIRASAERARAGGPGRGL